MASSGKKGKKSKGTAISLQSFLSNGDVPIGTTQVAKNIRNIDAEDSDENGSMLTVVCQLPTAPRANRIFDDNSIPHKSPFIAYVTNLPFDVQEEDIYEYFKASNIKSVRLPREDGDTGRVRGFGYVEFESRDSLIQSLGIRDPTIKGRRIRIDLSNESDQNAKQRGAKRAYESSGTNMENRESSNWRRDSNIKRDSYNVGGERSFNDQRYSSEGNNSPGSWRIQNQGTSIVSCSSERLHQKDQDEFRVDKNTAMERPKLILKPRTLPLPDLEIPLQISDSKTSSTDSSKYTGVPAEKVFGSAKPVDTTARDLQIEKRLSDVRLQDNLRKEIIKTTNDFNKLTFTKDQKHKVLSQNWRQQSENIEYSDRQNVRTDTSSEYLTEARKKYADKSEGFDGQKNKEGKRKLGMKIKGEPKIDIQGGRNVTKTNEVVISTNKYSGLDADTD